MKDEKIKKIFKSLNSFLTFFIIVAFVVTCCMTLFLNTMSKEMEVEFTADNITSAAKLTMLNVLLISIIITICDVVRRRITVDKPAKNIIDATRKMMKGDFSVRIKQSKIYEGEDKFSEIAECINIMAQELSSIETLRTDFIANASHELKTPLAVIQNYATLLQASDLSEAKRIEYAKAISSSSRRLANLVTNILKLNKLENQQITPKFEKYDLSEQVCECLLQFEDAWERKKLNIETDIEEDVTVLSDREMMSLVWNNLISNAIKFTDERGTVSVSLKTTEHHASVTVSDTGCGISHEVGAHMFDKFYQGDTSHATEGNGLGLALVKRVIDITQSSVSVESNQGTGTVFTVRMRK